MSTTQAPPLVSLQAPKDVSLEAIESELAQIWQTSAQKEEGLIATRATTFSFLVYEPDRVQSLLAALGYYTGPIDGITGPRMTAAIKSAQKALGVTATGLSSPEFKQALQTAFETAHREGNLLSTAERITKPYSPDLEGSGIADTIAASNPCRIITLCPTAEDDQGVQAQLSAYCPIQKTHHNTLICCEYITLRGTSDALERIGGVITELMLPTLPKYVWWKASPEAEYGLFQRLLSHADMIIVDSSIFNNPEQDLLQLAQLVNKPEAIADLNWSRLAPWQELTAEAFDPPERRSAVGEIDQISIDYEKGNHAQALMYLGWVASRLQWTPVSYSYQPGVYEIHKIQFCAPNQRPIEAELAGLPLADTGQVLGDLISLKLGSTNIQAQCGTVLCSGTVGCMRMEAGGGAQNYRVQQVTALDDQNTEQLLGRQLQRWGRDALYDESMAIVLAILQLSQAG
ncbi:glucose-6-phosphate dehydrogenase assembly protein OpcA [Synechocystis sp. CACIAM 05]|uniref:glucose-6-phosphate dehydrogenase assembly protein OpcA n=1 Tax=Synechocystis sp. CACIAM 05 TaxID=1933929 RepID=UPI00138E68E3|nr:glucose-6-phosphate dehydrogenase assembly protein OpcA [Synechocystis sp. CACIAM 05]